MKKKIENENVLLEMEQRERKGKCEASLNRLMEKEWKMPKKWEKG